MRNEVRTYYDAGVITEWTRLDRHPVEFEMTKRHLAPFIAPASHIADIGGGPGRYAFYFAERGHAVSLIDLSPENIAFARAHARTNGVALDEACVGDATDLSAIDSEMFDVTLCLGPLYHLPNERDRADAINECIRITRPEGAIAYAFISPVAHAISVLVRNPAGLGDAATALHDVFTHGENRTDYDLGFTHAHYMRAHDVRPYLETFGLHVRVVAGVETLVWAIEERIDELDSKTRAKWLDYCFDISTDASIMGASQHILAVCTKADD